ncbi:MAG: putative selenate reductase subunit YgfK, partial [Candidatus Bipolaricaulota bacterium]|nr:putative selenate reductase subunit YgfK [Candidatus Bipolaricaulota bacterium]
MVLDHLDIPRPCIDAADAGFNVEWSQELSLDQSAREYAHAWALVHVLPRALGFRMEEDGVVFNQSVGYTLEGVRSAAVERFLDRLANAREFLDPVRRTLQNEFPHLGDVEFPDHISDSVTLSTMHGCPPEEIEKIARHLLENRGLHTVVKLNPTLLGKSRVMEILRDRLGFESLEIPDDVFDHDLGFSAALDLISSLRATAARCGRGFAVKLSNTLAMRNPRDV